MEHAPYTEAHGAVVSVEEEGQEDLSNAVRLNYSEKTYFMAGRGQIDLAITCVAIEQSTLFVAYATGLTAPGPSEHNEQRDGRSQNQ